MQLKVKWENAERERVSTLSRSLRSLLQSMSACVFSPLSLSLCSFVALLCQLVITMKNDIRTYIITLV